MIIGLQNFDGKRPIRHRLSELGATRCAEFIVEPLFVKKKNAAGETIRELPCWIPAISDLELQSKDWVSNVVGICASRYNQEEEQKYTGGCTETHMEKHSEEGEAQLRREDSYSSHLGLQALILPSPDHRSCGISSSVRYAQIIRSMCEAAPACSYKQYWVTFDIDLTGKDDQWKEWDRMRYLVNHHPKIGIVLNFLDWRHSRGSQNQDQDQVDVQKVESLSLAENIVNRWLSEPIKAVFMPDWCFENEYSSGEAFFQYAPLKPLFRQKKLHVIHNALYDDDHTGNLSKDNMTRKSDLLGHHVQCTTNASAHIDSYKDTLQAPLQPLADNLESGTYEVFEKDVVKYERYELAIFKALEAKRDMRTIKAYDDEHSRDLRIQQMNIPLTGRPSTKYGGGTNNYTSNSRKRGLEQVSAQVQVDREGVVGKSSRNDHASANSNAASIIPLRVAIVGAGRGPLVACTIRAAATVGVHVRIVCVEKNENAMHTLRSRCSQESFWEEVELFEGDMRLWKPEYPFDLLISELLGSWGDNELSPECLDGVIHCLKTDGVCIPQSYTSYIAPLSSSVLWTGCRDLLQGKGLETPYVVNLNSCHYPAGKDVFSKLFNFTHSPTTALLANTDNSHNRRYSCVRFKAECDATLHGLAGFFESTLYGDVKISTLPTTWKTQNKNMYSWFPMFLPFGSPVPVKNGDMIEVSVWRCTSGAVGHRVWYEWCLTEPHCLPIQNSEGKVSYIGL